MKIINNLFSSSMLSRGKYTYNFKKCPLIPLGSWLNKNSDLIMVQLAILIKFGNLEKVLNLGPFKIKYYQPKIYLLNIEIALKACIELAIKHLNPKPSKV